MTLSNALDRALRAAQKGGGPAGETEAEGIAASASGGALAPRVAALIVGGGGLLGSALLSEALVAPRFARVRALVAAPLKSSLRGLDPLDAAALEGRASAAAGAVVGCELAFVVFERRRFSNGRDDAFVMPEPAELLPLARRLRDAAVRDLIVLVPHSPALLPHALKHGFATRDEAAVAALGFERVVFVRAAQEMAGAGGAQGGLRRFADWWLSQLRWMVPPREQALRAPALARVVVLLGCQLVLARAGARVVPPELLWQAARGTPSDADAQALLARWLDEVPRAAP